MVLVGRFEHYLATHCNSCESAGAYEVTRSHEPNSRYLLPAENADVEYIARGVCLRQGDNIVRSVAYSY